MKPFSFSFKTEPIWILVFSLAPDRQMGALNHMSLSKFYFKNEAIWTLIFTFGPLVGALVVGLLVVLVVRLLR